MSNAECCYAECRLAGCHIFIVMLRISMLEAVILSIIMPCVMLSVTFLLLCACHYAERCYAECRGATQTAINYFDNWCQCFQAFFSPRVCKI